MIQLRVNFVENPTYDYYLDLYEENLPKLTLSVEDIQSTDTTTTFSRTFRIPATTRNSEYFSTLFDVNGYDFDITSKHPATILVDGNEYKRGEIRLQNIYHNSTKGIIDYELVFLGDIRSFATSIGESHLCELDLSYLAHDITLANITSSWQAYPETPSTSTDGLFEGSIIYPLVDFGNTYDDDYVAQETRIENGSSDSFVQNSHPLSINRLRPCVKVKDVWDKIFSNADYTYTSTFLESNLFRHLYVGAWGDDANIELSPSFYGYPTIDKNVNPVGLTQMNLDEATNNYDDWDFANDYYVIPQNGTYDIFARFRVESGFIDIQDPGAKYVEYRIRIWKLGIPIPLASVNRTIDYQGGVAGNGIEIDSLTLNLENQSFTAFDKVYATIEVINENDWGGSTILGTNATSLRIKLDIGYNPGLGLSCDYKQIDFIRDIITKFRLVMAPDKNDINNFIIEPWADYVGSGDVFDWTPKLDESKDFVIKPIFFTQKDQIEFVDSPGDDFLSVYNQDNVGEVYGRLLFDSENELLKGKRTIETGLVPLASQQIEEAKQANNGMDNTIIPQIHDHDVEINSSNNAVILHNPVKPGVRIFWWDGMKHTGTTSARDRTWYLTDGTTTISRTKFPMISQFNEWGDRDDSWQGVDTQTKDLNWQRENTWIKWGMADVELGGSVYDYYWSNYINNLYDKWSRRITAYFILESNDLLNFSFDDVIFIKNAYYYVEKIYDVIVGEQSSVKVDLIKLNNYYPDITNFIPVGTPWGEITEFWEGITDNWEDV